MVKLLVMALLVVLCVCCYLLIDSPFESPKTLEQPAPHTPEARFGGMYRRELGNDPVTLDPTLVTDTYGGAGVRQLFDGLVQFDTYLRSIPALAQFWEASRDRRAWTFALRRGVRYPRDSATATGALPPGMPGYDPKLQGYAYDPAKAKWLLAEAGYPDGAGVPVVQLWSVTKSETAKAELVAYQRYLAGVGVQVEIHFAPDWPTYRAMLGHGQLPMFRLAWDADIPDPDNVLSALLHSTGSSNYTLYRNPRVDQLSEQARREFDEAQRMALYREVERLVMDDPPWIAQQYYMSEYLYRPYVQGVEINWLGPRATPVKKIWLKNSLAEGSAAAMTDVQPRQ